MRPSGGDGLGWGTEDERRALLAANAAGPGASLSQKAGKETTWVESTQSPETGVPIYAWLLGFHGEAEFEHASQTGLASVLSHTKALSDLAGWDDPPRTNPIRDINRSKSPQTRSHLSPTGERPHREEESFHPSEPNCGKRLPGMESHRHTHGPQDPRKWFYSSVP